MLARALRPRVLIYLCILLAIVAAAAFSLWSRVPLKVDVIRDRAAIVRDVEGGLIENVYRLQIMNTTEQARAFEVSVSGLPTLHVQGEATVGMPAAASRMIPVKVRIETSSAAPGTHPIEFTVRTIGVEGVSVHEKSVFIVK
jgi:polyferredoxin